MRPTATSTARSRSARTTELRSSRLRLRSVLTPAACTPAMFDVKPEARYDSWLTFNQDDGENKDKINSIGIDWDAFNNGGKLETQDGAVFLMNPEEIPPFTGELPEEIADKTGRTILLAQLTVNRGTTFTGHVNVQGRRPDGGSWQEHGVCFSIGKGCTKHPRHDE